MTAPKRLPHHWRPSPQDLLICWTLACLAGTSWLLLRVDRLCDDNLADCS